MVCRENHEPYVRDVHGLKPQKVPPKNSRSSCTLLFYENIHRKAGNGPLSMWGWVRVIFSKKKVLQYSIKGCERKMLLFPQKSQ